MVNILDAKFAIKGKTLKCLHVKYSRNGDHQYQLSCLKSNIFKQATSKCQKAAKNIVNTKHTIDVSIQTQVESEAQKTASLFRTAYFMSKKNRPFTDHHELLVLQQENGLDMGITLHSKYTAKNILDHTTDEMKKKVLNHSN